MSEIDNLRRNVSLAETATRFGVQLKKDGDEFVACCPFHTEDTPSFSIFRGKDHVERFHCFGCGKRGDVLDFVQEIKGVDLREARSILGGGSVGANVAPRAVEARDIYAGIVTLPPVSGIAAGRKVKLYNPKRAGTEREWGSFAPSLVHPYRLADGTPLGYVLRHDMTDGKETPMVMRVRLADGTECWSRFPFPKPRPLYGVETIGDARQVIVVEGEKCRDALAKALDRVVVSWAGGTQGVKHTDWTPLAGRNVIVWPDADAPGVKTADEVSAILHGLEATARVLAVALGGAKRGKDDPPYTTAEWAAGTPAPEGWDCADAIDAGWTFADLMTFMRETVRPWVPPASPAPATEARSAPAGPSTPPAPSAPVREARTVQQEQPQQATVTQLHTRKTVKADDSWLLDLVMNEEGKTKPGVTKNWALFLEHHEELRGVFAYDAFKLRVTLQRRPPWDWRLNHWEPRVLQDRDYSEAVMWLEARYMTPKVSNIAAVIQTVAEHHSFDRLTEYLEGLRWDQRPRLEKWLSYYMGVDDSEYARTVGRCWLISAVARGLQAGCKVDTMPILEGPQGARKSTAIRALFGDEFFTDELSDIGSKDAMMEMQGVWGLEVAEMHRFSAAETNQVKKFLTRQTDRFRPPYGRSVIEAPRRVVLNGTINPEGNAYLRDPTGARRFWPLTVGRIAIDDIVADRDQLWAEAVHLYRANTPWWVQEEDQPAVEFEQEKRTDVDVWVDMIVPMLRTRVNISQTEIFGHLGIASKDADWRHSHRVGRIMKKLGWTSRRDRTGGEDKVVFDNPEAAGELGGGEW